MARQLYYRDSYGRVHRDPPARGGGVTIVVYGRTEIRLGRVPDKDEARGSSRRAPVARPQLDRGRAAGPGHGRRLRAAAGAWRRFRFTRRPGYEPARRLTFRSRAGKDAVRSRLSSYTRSSIAPRNAEGPR
jgi:hypothetical protein